MKLYALLREDFEAAFVRRPTLFNMLIAMLHVDGWRAVFLYRVSSCLLSAGLLYIARLCSSMNLILTGADVSPRSKIGGGFQVKHPMGVVVGDGVVAGKLLTLLQGVTLGEDYSLANRGMYPTLGDRVTVCSNAVIVGPSIIGDDVLVGANSFVSKQLMGGRIYAGAPASDRGPHEAAAAYWRN